jgi:hypothetical protein
MLILNLEDWNFQKGFFSKGGCWNLDLRCEIIFYFILLLKVQMWCMEGLGFGVTKLLYNLHTSLTTLHLFVVQDYITT